MAYNGYLVKIGSYTVPFKYIQYDNYSVVFSVNDLDSYRDADGKLHRKALANRTIKVEWQIPPMSNTDIQVFLQKIRDNYTDAIQKKVNLTAFVPEKNSYVTEECYLTSDVNFSIRYADANRIEYDATRIAFIGYTTGGASV